MAMLLHYCQHCVGFLVLLRKKVAKHLHNSVAFNPGCHCDDDDDSDDDDDPLTSLRIINTGLLILYC